MAQSQQQFPSSSSSTDASPAAQPTTTLLLPPSNPHSTISSQSSCSSFTESSLETTPTIPSILKSSSHHSLRRRTQSTNSSSGDTATPPLPPVPLGISFAPLPQLAPRKRKSTVQLGVAARSNMLRHRRMFMVSQEEAMRYQNEEQEGIAIVNEDGSGNGDSRTVVFVQPGGSRGGAGGGYTYSRSPINQLPRDPGLGEDAVEDAFVGLGRMMKGAGKSLWKKMRRASLDDVGSKEREDEGREERDKDKKKSNSLGSKSRKMPSRGWSTDDVSALLASEGGGQGLLSLQAILEESSQKPSSPPEEVADIVLRDPNAPHPSEHLELPDTSIDFLNMTQPTDEPCPPTALPELADDTDSDTSHSTAERFELPSTPPTEPASERVVVGS